MDMKKLIKETVLEMFREGELELDVEIRPHWESEPEIIISLTHPIYNEDGIRMGKEKLTTAEAYY